MKQTAANELGKLSQEILATVSSKACDFLNDMGFSSVALDMFNVVMKAGQSRLEHKRIREIAAFGTKRLISSLSDRKLLDIILKTVAVRVSMEQEQSVRLILASKDTSHNMCYNQLISPTMPFIDELLLSEEESRAMEIQAWKEQEESIQKEITNRVKSLDDSHNLMLGEPDPLKKQELMVKCSLERKALNQALKNMGDVGKKLDIVIDFLSAMQDSLDRIEGKLDRLQSDMTEMRQQLKGLVGRPYMEVLDEYSKRFLQQVASQLPHSVYVEASVCGEGMRNDFLPSIDNPSMLVSMAFQDFMEPKRSNLAKILTTSDGLSSGIKNLNDQRDGVPISEDSKDGPLGSDVKKDAIPAVPEDVQKIVKPTAEDTEEKSTTVGRNVMLLAGEAGSGKSTAVDKFKSYILGKYTESRKKYNKRVVLIPISLPTLKDPLGNLFDEGIKIAFNGEIRPNEVQQLREDIHKNGSDIEVVFILDAYDELRSDLMSNLWLTNNLEQYRDASAKDNYDQPKVLITTRSEFLYNKLNYQELFLPIESENKDKIPSNSFIEMRLTPFGNKRADYQRQFVALSWRNTFRGRFLAHPSMFDYDNDVSTTREEVKVGHKEGPKHPPIPTLIKEDKSSVSSKLRSIFSIKGKDSDKLLDQLLDVYFTSSVEVLPDDGSAIPISKETFWGTCQETFTTVTVPDEEQLQLMIVSIISASCIMKDHSESKRIQESCIDFLDRNSKELWLLQDYNKAFDAIPELQELSSTPFMGKSITKTLSLHYFLFILNKLKIFSASGDRRSS